MVFPWLWFVIFWNLGELRRPDEDVAVGDDGCDGNHANHHEVVQHILEFVILEAGGLDEHGFVVMSTHLSDLDCYKERTKLHNQEHKVYILVTILQDLRSSRSSQDAIG